tara:strand:- start:1336 stop:2409 length:1074 start_codon:yes stop_codon:yes gene_type:complete
MAFDSDFTKRFKITSDNTLVPSDQTDIPLALDLSTIGSGHDFWTDVLTSGADIRVVEDDETTEVPVEVDKLDTTAKTGQIYFKSDITAASDTDYYVYYGYASASAPGVSTTYGQYNVWDSTYGAVYHLGDSSAENVVDSTGNQLNEGSGSSSATSVTALFGKGFDFNGSSNIITFETGVDTYVSPTAQLQFELWFNSDTQSNDVLLETRLDSTNKGYGLWFWNGQLRPSCGVGSSGNPWTNVTYPMTSINNGTWYKVVVTYNASAVEMFVDDVSRDSYAITGSIAYTGTQMNFGTRAGGDDFDGTLDEIWISTSARADDWNTVVYNWQVDNGAFWTVGAGEDNPGAGGTFVPKMQII